MEDEIKKAELIVGGMSLHEIFYGGPKGPGLTMNIAMLKDTVSNLALTVAELSRNLLTISNDVNGSEGLRSSMKELRREMSDLRTRSDKAEALAWRAIWSLAFIGFGTLIIDSRVAYTVFMGGPK